MAFIRKFLDLSTSHLTRDDRAYLDRESGRSAQDNPGVALSSKTQSGFFVYAYAQNEHAILNAYGVPDGLRTIMAHASRLKCDYILFDDNSPTSSELPLFLLEAETA